MKILFLSHTSETGPFRVGSHHLSRGLARLGNNVVHASSPVSLAHLIRSGHDPALRSRLAVALRGVIRESENYATVIPLQVLPLFDRTPLLNWFSANFPLRPWKNAVVRALGGSPDVVMVDRAAMFFMTGFFPDSLFITRATDLPRSVFEKSLFEQAARKSHAVIGTSFPVLEMLRTSNSMVPHLLLQNGVEIDRFLAPVKPAWDSRRGAVYVGALDERFDWDWVRCVATSSPDTRIDIWGPLNRANLPADLPNNCKLLGPLPYERLPEVLAQYRVGLLPLVESDANRGRSPMKLFEYLAASLRVISTPTDTLRSHVCEDIWLSPLGEELAQVFSQVIKLPEPQDGVKVSTSYSWVSRAEILEKFLRNIGRNFVN